MVCGVVLGAALCGDALRGAAPAHAQTADVETRPAGDADAAWNRGVPLATREAARQKFLEGNRLFRVPLFARAAEHYRAALASWEHPAFHFNLALALLNLGADLEARAALERALAHGAGPIGTDQLAEGRKQLRDLEARLGRIEVAVTTPGARVSIDGAAVLVGPGRYAGWVAAGEHEVAANKPHHVAEVRRVAVSAGELEQVSLALITVDEAADAGRRWANWRPWTAVIAGAAVAATGGVLHALAARDFEAYDRDFSKLPCSIGGCARGDIPAPLRDQLDGAHRTQQIAVGAYIAGGALLATGAVLLYLNRPRLLESERVAVVPAVSRDLVGVLVEVRP